MINDHFEAHSAKALALLKRYYTNLPGMQVKTEMSAGDLLKQLPTDAPANPETIDNIIKDIDEKIIPGLTHWQHPGFMALFPSNVSFPSFLGEIIAAGLGVNCMMWDTAPAAAELEQRMMEWLRDMCHLPKSWQGIIQDTASTATLTAVIAAREKITNYSINENGFYGTKRLILYTSNQAHVSVVKAAKAAGIGSNNVRLISVNSDFSMNTTALQNAIDEDIEQGNLPFMIAATLGTTSTLAFDSIDEIGTLCKKYNMWLHVDAAYAGNAFVLEEYASFLKGIEKADSYVFNPHKWLFTHFDCSVMFVSDHEQLLKTFSSSPDYLKASRDGIRNYKDWGLALGRRFRSLKLWFVIRNMGINGIKQRLRYHIKLAEKLCDNLKDSSHWQFPAPMIMNVITVRWFNPNLNLEQLNTNNNKLLEHINSDGRFYLSGTKLDDAFVIRIVPAQTDVQESNVNELFHQMEKIASQLDESITL